MVDATIIHAPSSTKNATKSRDPEMHSTKKGNRWYFGMKIHSGADAATGYVHTITATVANVHDIARTHALIREDDHSVYGDSGYLGVEKRAKIRGDAHLSSVDYRIAKRPSKNRISKEYRGENRDRKMEYEKASVRSKVEHPFLIVKKLFHAGRTRYRGLRKNLLQYYLLFASANLVMCLRAGRQREFCMTTG
ncbi:IS5 family transposase [Selenomonas sp. TAMA-11512]|uniref:IS5 family transposase n=1 Tax=Selenomonas sp. TAMA-11512 TaxID=3095337 RepID=UPI0030CB9E7B